MNIEVYTDGCCLGNPGPGGYGIVIFIDGEKEEISGGESDTTNNRMEMKAAIVALRKVKEHKTPLKLFTDSKYVIDGISKWIHGWKRNGWKTSTKKPVKNDELWKELDALNQTLRVEWTWVKGHSDNEWNNRCDELAKQAASQFQHLGNASIS